MRNGGLHTEVRGSSPNVLRVLCMPMCYIVIATFAMLGENLKQLHANVNEIRTSPAFPAGLITVITFLANYITWPFSLFYMWGKGGSDAAALLQQKYLPCDNIEVRDVWVEQFPKLLTESAFRLLDVN